MAQAKLGVGVPLFCCSVRGICHSCRPPRQGPFPPQLPSASSGAFSSAAADRPRLGVPAWVEYRVSMPHGWCPLGPGPPSRGPARNKEEGSDWVSSLQGADVERRCLEDRMLDRILSERNGPQGGRERRRGGGLRNLR